MSSSTKLPKLTFLSAIKAPSASHSGRDCGSPGLAAPVDVDCACREARWNIALAELFQRYDEQANNTLSDVLDSVGLFLRDNSRVSGLVLHGFLRPVGICAFERAAL